VDQGSQSNRAGAAPVMGERTRKGQNGAQADSLFRQVTDRLATAIVSGRLEVGQLIPNEADLSRELPVSRTAYREAVKFISGKGLVEARPRSGTRVAPRTAWNLLDPDVVHWVFTAGADERFVHDLYELRLFIEPGAARLAAARRSKAQLAAIEAALIGMEENPPFSEENIAADLDYHSAIIAASGNSALACLQSVVRATVRWSVEQQVAHGPRPYLVALADHRRVYDAIARQDTERAAALMTTIVIDSLHHTLNAVRDTLPGQTRAMDSAE